MHRYNAPVRLRTDRGFFIYTRTTVLGNRCGGLVGALAPPTKIHKTDFKKSPWDSLPTQFSNIGFPYASTTLFKYWSRPTSPVEPPPRTLHTCMAKVPDYGQIIFAPHRTDAPKPPERNTPEEAAAWDAFQKHYFGGKDDRLNALVDEVLTARDSGWYTDYLTVPKKYTRAYRIINDIPAAVAKKLIPSFPQDGTEWGWVGGGRYSPHKGRINSWTVDTGIMPRLLRDFGGAFYRRNPGAYHMIFVCDLNQNRGGFFMNPDTAYENTPRLAGVFSYQREIISVDSLPLKGAAFCRHDEFGGDDAAILKKLIALAGGK